MAEIFFVTRGHADHVEKFERSMRSLSFPMNFKKKVKDELGQEMEVDTTLATEGQLRPYQFWGYVCPEPFVQPLCNALGIPTQETWFDQKEVEPGGTSFRGGFGVQGFLTAMRLALKAKKLPPIDLTKGTYAVPIYRKHINVLGIGWKPDAEIKTAMGEHEGV